MPTPNEIKEKIEELRDAYIQDDDYLMDAIIGALDEVRALVNARTHDDLLWAHDQLNNKIRANIQHEHKLLAEALDSLVSLEGHTVQTAVDNFKFVPHDTRY